MEQKICDPRIIVLGHELNLSRINFGGRYSRKSPNLMKFCGGRRCCSRVLHNFASGYTPPPHARSGLCESVGQQLVISRYPIRLAIGQAPISTRIVRKILPAACHFPLYNSVSNGRKPPFQLEQDSPSPRACTNALAKACHCPLSNSISSWSKPRFRQNIIRKAAGQSYSKHALH